MRRLMHGTLTMSIVIACSASGRTGTADTATHVDTIAHGPAVVPAAPVASLPAAERQDTIRRPVGLPGRPKRPAVPPPNRSCVGTFVSVTVKESTLANGSDRTAALRSVARRVLEPVSAFVGKTELSPAIRAFRVSVRDSGSTQRVLSKIRASPIPGIVELNLGARRVPEWEEQDCNYD